MCLGCRQPFGFIRKWHNCYNCGAVFCHACSSKKSSKASLAPNPNRPYRVCDPCLIKLKRAAESGVTVGPLSRRVAPSQWPIEVRGGLVQVEPKVPRAQPPPSKSAMIFEAVKHIDRKPVPKRMKKPESSSSHVAPAQVLFHHCHPGVLWMSQLVSTQNFRQQTPQYPNLKLPPLTLSLHLGLFPEQCHLCQGR